MTLGKPAAATADAVVELLDACAYQLRVGYFASDLPQAQWVALRFFARCNPNAATVMSYAQLHGITGGTASRTVALLERRGLLSRHVSTTDRRSSRLSVTKQGERVLDGDPLRVVAQAIEGADAKSVSAAGELLYLTLQTLTKTLGRADNQVQQEG